MAANFAPDLATRHNPLPPTDHFSATSLKILFARIDRGSDRVGGDARKFFPLTFTRKSRSKFGHISYGYIRSTKADNLGMKRWQKSGNFQEFSAFQEKFSPIFGLFRRGKPCFADNFLNSYELITHHRPRLGLPRFCVCRGAWRGATCGRLSSKSGKGPTSRGSRISWRQRSQSSPYAPSS